jgi:hypothetical protein
MADVPLKLDTFITDLKLIKLSPDETLVVRVPEEYCEEIDTMVHMRQAIADVVGTQKVIIVADTVNFEVIKNEGLCQHCGGSNRDEAGKPCEFCPSWLPRKFA